MGRRAYVIRLSVFVQDLLHLFVLTDEGPKAENIRARKLVDGSSFETVLLSLSFLLLTLPFLVRKEVFRSRSSNLSFSLCLWV